MTPRGGSFTVGPRVEFDLDGYVRIRAWDADRGHDRYLYLHRLAAYAHGELEDLHASDHVHHSDGDRWNNDPANLEARDPVGHGELHLNGGALS
ncbi:MAG: HNH endonuclease [Halobacteriaceae archaeon]